MEVEAVIKVSAKGKCEFCKAVIHIPNLVYEFIGSLGPKQKAYVATAGIGALIGIGAARQLVSFCTLNCLIGAAAAGGIICGLACFAGTKIGGLPFIGKALVVLGSIAIGAICGYVIFKTFVGGIVGAAVVTGCVFIGHQAQELYSEIKSMKEEQQKLSEEQQKQREEQQKQRADITKLQNSLRRRDTNNDP